MVYYEKLSVAIYIRIQIDWDPEGSLDKRKNTLPL